MASSLRQPEKLSFDGNAPENLRIFLMEFEIYLAAAHPKATGETKVNILLNLAGRDAIERSQNFAFANDEERKNVNVWKEKFKELCNPLKNLTILRHNFNTRAQQPEESFQAYLTAIRNMAESCEFGPMRSEMLKDRVVVGIRNEKTRDVLFAEPKLDLPRAIEICNLHEGAEKAAEALKKEADVCVVHKKKTPKRHEKSKKVCSFCGYEHPFEKKKCPAYGKTCAKCGLKNHFALMCKQQEDSEDEHNRVHEIELYNQEETARNYVIE